MPNVITIIKAVTVSTPNGSQTFNIGDTVQPTSAYYWHLLWGNYSSDSGVSPTVPFILSVSTDEIERQRERQLNDRRSKLPLSTEATITRSVTADGALTKSYSVDVSAQTNLTSAVMTTAQKNALPVDLGTPAFQKIVYKSSPAGYVWSGPSKDPAVIPASPNNNPLAVSEFRMRTNAPKIAFTLYRLLGAAQNGDQVFVNGMPCQIRPTAGSAAVDFLFLTFPDSQVRDIAIRTAAGFGPINIAPTYDVWKPESPRLGLSMYCIGDSYSAATVYNDAGSVAGMQEEGLAASIEDWLGFADNYIDAVGGTGWTVRTNGYQGPNNNYQDRWPQVLRANPDVLFVPNGAANDCYGSVDPNTIAASIATCFRQLRAQNGKTKFIFADGCTPPFGAFATNATRYLALRNILIPMLQDVGVYYIDTTGWLYGTGYLTAKNASGNSDNYVGADATHLSGLGYRYLKIRLAHKLRRILLDDGTLLNTVIT